MGGALVVTGEHDDVDALRVSILHGLRRLRAKLVADADHARDTSVSLDDDDRHSLPGHLLRVAAQLAASSQRSLPTLMARPPTVPSIPAPATSDTSAAGVFFGADAVMAVASGCVLVASNAAAHARTCSVATPAMVRVSTTAGSLRVSVPVLSSATVRIVPSCSNASPDLMTTPNFDADPIALMTVTGTAIASAQGEAATRTTRARSIQVDGSPTSEAEQCDEGGGDEDCRHQGLGDAVSQARPLTLSGVGLFDERHDLRQRVVGPRGGRLYAQRRGAVDRSGGDRVPGTDFDGYGFSGDRGRVHTRAPFDDDAVGGHTLACPDDEDVELLYIGSRDCEVASESGDADGVGDQRQERTQAFSCPVHGAVFQRFCQ